MFSTDLLRLEIKENEQLQKKDRRHKKVKDSENENRKKLAGDLLE